MPVEPLGILDAAELFVERGPPARTAQRRGIRPIPRSSSSAPAWTGCRSPSSWPPVRCVGGACPSCAAASMTPPATWPRGPTATNHGTAR